MGTRDFSNRKLGHYRILEPLGSGGMGDVFLAMDDRLGRKVALKVIGAAQSASPTARKRLRREARAAAAIDHPGVCTIYEVSEEGGESYIAMQYVEGESLAERLRRGPMTHSEIRTVARQIGEALAAAHDRGVLHRDIKPQNIMLTPSGRVVVLDFGLASFTQNEELSRLTLTGQVVGTPSYMSPEQLSAGDLDHRSDIFSFGVLLYELLTSRCPFSRPSVTATIAAVLFEHPGLADIPVEWQPLVNRALSKERGKRFGDMTELLRELDSLSEWERLGDAGNKTTAAMELRRPEPVRDGPSSSAARSAIAVMPFAADPHLDESEYAAESLTDTAIDALSRVPGLRVMARSTVFRYRGDPDPETFGRSLNVASVLAGDLQRRAGRIVLHMELVSVESGERLWSRRLEQPESEASGLHDLVGAAVASHFGVAENSTDLKAPPSRDPEAFRHYLVGRHQWNRRTGPATRIAIQSFQKAIDLDPLLAPAYVGLADALSYMGFLEVMLPTAVFPRSRAAAEQALSLEPESGEALTSLGLVSAYHDFQFERASAFYRQALAANPNYGVAHHWYGLLLVFHGDIEEGAKEIEKARKLDPLNPILNVATAFPHYYRREFGEAIAIYRNLLDLEPNFMPLRNYLGATLSIAGQPEEAVEHCRIALDLGGGSTIASASLGFALARLGEENEARELLGSLERARATRYSSAFAPAVIHAGLNEIDASIEWLNVALEERCPWLLTTRMDSRFDALRGDPRFDDFLRRVGFWNL